MKKALVFVLILFSQQLLAEVQDFSQNNFSSNGSLSILSSGSSNVLNINLSSEFGFRNVNIGTGLNLVIPESKRPSNLSMFELKSISYNDTQLELRYGQIKSLTMAHGLLMDNYNSNANYTYFKQSNTGVTALFKGLRPLNAYTLYTLSNIAGIRLIYSFFDNTFLNKPVNLGINLLSDIDGAQVNNQTVNKGMMNYSFDYDISLIPDILSQYSEIAFLANKSSGTAIGLRYVFNSSLSSQFEYRLFSSNFYPNVFNNYYEVQPINLDAYISEPLTGYYAQIDYNFFSIAKASIGFADYQSKNTTFKAGLLIHKLLKYRIALNYEKYFAPDTYNLLKLTIAYPVNNFSSIVVNITKVGTLDPEYSVSYTTFF